MWHKIVQPGDIAKAAAEKMGTRSGGGAFPKWNTISLESFTLDKEFLERVSHQHIVAPEPFAKNKSRFILHDEYVLAPPEHNSWIFRAENAKKLELKVELVGQMVLDYTRRTVWFSPRVIIPLGSSPMNERMHCRMFRFLISHYRGPLGALGLANRLMSDDNFALPFADCGFGGVRSKQVLFWEFVGDNAAIRELARLGILFKDSESLDLVAESSQGNLFEEWRNQLEDYQRSLRSAMKF
jgi:hypothetical protein